MTGESLPVEKHSDTLALEAIRAVQKCQSAGIAVKMITGDHLLTAKAIAKQIDLTKFIVWTNPTNIAETLVLLTAILLGTALPALPVQFLWVNLTTAILLGLALVFEPKERDLMQRTPAIRAGRF